MYIPSFSLQSLDYDICYNVPYKNMIRKFTKYVCWKELFYLCVCNPSLYTLLGSEVCIVTIYVFPQTYIHMEVMRWFLVGIIGLLTGIVAAFIGISVKELFKGKYIVFDKGEWVTWVCMHACWRVSLHLLAPPFITQLIDTVYTHMQCCTHTCLCTASHLVCL